jgi:hypothetical protein
MRKRYWVLLAIMALGGIGNLIGGTDTPARGAVDPAARPGAVQANVPVAPRFDATAVCFGQQPHLCGRRAARRLGSRLGQG